MKHSAHFCRYIKVPGLCLSVEFKMSSEADASEKNKIKKIKNGARVKDETRRNSGLSKDMLARDKFAKAKTPPCLLCYMRRM